MSAEKPITEHFHKDGRPLSLERYRAVGGYQGLGRALKEMSRQDVIKAVLDSKLTGRGGAGFPAGRKWGFVDTTHEWAESRFLVANADEMEPGAFKDRIIMQGSPHQVLEGIAIAAYAIGAATAYLFLRAEYGATARIMRRAIRDARKAGLLGKSILGTDFDLDVYLHVSAGRYICGEASAMLTAIEGERAVPRHKPPHMASSGLWSKPTVVNNVETLAYVPTVILKGPEWFAKLGAAGEGGMKIYTVSGRVRRPGAWELPLGVTIRELIEEHAGGMKEGLGLRAVLPGGGSTRFLLAKDLDTPMDEASLTKVGSRLGTGTIIVLDDQTCPVGMLANLEHFYSQESCGWCTPCWQGLQWVEQLLRSIEEGHGVSGDIDLLEWHAGLIKPGHTFCDLAPGAMEPLQSGLEFFHDDFVQHVKDARCPWRTNSGRWLVAASTEGARRGPYAEGD